MVVLGNAESNLELWERVNKECKSGNCGKKKYSLLLPAPTQKVRKTSGIKEFLLMDGDNGNHLFSHFDSTILHYAFATLQLWAFITIFFLHLVCPCLLVPFPLISTNSMNSSPSFQIHSFISSRKHLLTLPWLP